MRNLPPFECRVAIEELAFQLFDTLPVAYRNWTCLYDPDMPWKKVDFSRETPPHPFYYASVAGLDGLVKRFL